MRLGFESAARMMRKAKALFEDDDTDRLQSRLAKLVARPRSEVGSRAPACLSAGIADTRAAPLYDQSVYGSPGSDAFDETPL